MTQKLILFLSIFFMFFVYGCTTNINSVPNTNLLINKCPSNIIPDGLWLECNPNSGCKIPSIYYTEAKNPVTEKMRVWADNSSIVGGSDYPICHEGYKEGQNVNYIYCGDEPYRRIFYSKKEITKEGLILPEEIYRIELILDSKNFTQETYDIYFGQHAIEKRTFMKFRILSASCEKSSNTFQK